MSVYQFECILGTEGQKYTSNVINNWKLLQYFQHTNYHQSDQNQILKKLRKTNKIILASCHHYCGLHFDTFLTFILSFQDVETSITTTTTKTMKKEILQEFGLFLVLLLSLNFPEIQCQIGRGYQENHPNHVLGSQQLQQQLRYEESIATTIQTPQTGN